MRFKTASLHDIEQRNIQKYKYEMPKLINNDTFINLLKKIGYFTAPSSCDHHGAWFGGNFDHSLLVTNYLLEYTRLCPEKKWIREESPYIVGMFHDICKSDQRKFIIKDYEIDIEFRKNKDMRHSEKSIDILSSYLKLLLTIEEILCIYFHMGKTENVGYNQLMSRMAYKYEKISWTQIADIQAAIIDGV